MQVLKDEHRVIERVLDAMERQLSKPMDAGFYRQTIDFLRNFADSCHHAKEEDELFPVLESAGVPREQGPIGCMLEEHRMGRALVRKMEAQIDPAASGEAAAVEALRATVADYIQLLRQHIDKEDNVLFAMADQILGPEEQALMRCAFDRAGGAKSCSSKHQYYVDLADQLSTRSG